MRRLMLSGCSSSRQYVKDGETMSVYFLNTTYLEAGSQVPGQEGEVVALVTVSVVLAMGALILSEWLARRMAQRVAA